MLNAHQITLERGGKKLFQGLNLQVQPGQLLRVSGSNGSGKSTLLRILCGLLAPISGHVSWNGQDIQKDRDAFHRQLVYLGHSPALKNDLTAIENLINAQAFSGFRIAAAHAKEALDHAGLGQLGRRFVRTLSQGQKQRVALARLWLSPARSIWLLDEPFNALDHAANHALQETIKAHLNQGGIVALSSHQPLDIDQLPGAQHLAL
jgi:heme exporter protein A